MATASPWTVQRMAEIRDKEEKLIKEICELFSFVPKEYSGNRATLVMATHESIAKAARDLAQTAEQGMYSNG